MIIAGKIDPSSHKSAQYESGEYVPVRTSYKSATTARSSSTERSSVLTRDTSVTDCVTLSPVYYDQPDGGMSVDDAIGMYERGFDDDYDDDYDDDVNDDNDIIDTEPVAALQHRRSAWDSNLRNDMNIRATEAPPIIKAAHPPTPEKALPPHPEAANRMESPNESQQQQQQQQQQPRLFPSLAPPTPSMALCERDRYGFRIVSQYVTLAQHRSWDASYSEYVERRRKKWVVLLREQGLPTHQPERFPERSQKVKRFVRKGIPPEWRGAAWFWYAGGHEELNRHLGLYQRLVDEAEKGRLSRNDRELIERDLHRTFPDNVKFKPNPTVLCDPADLAGGWAPPGGNCADVETPIIRSLRRVLQAFSIHRPKIGYCQSLNFLAGLLLLFMDEEKTFWMLNIITRLYLPGTHGLNLEGANVDLTVLTASLRESMPSIWAKLAGDMDGFYDGGGGGETTLTGTRLPPVFLCATAWFMSCFIGTLPIETTLRVWDAFFYEGSRTLFRIALAIFKVGEQEIKAVSDPMEIFQVVQTIPKRLLDASALMDACYKRRNGFGHITQDTIDDRRRRWRAVYAREHATAAAAASAAASASGSSNVKGIRTIASSSSISTSSASASASNSVRTRTSGGTSTTTTKAMPETMSGGLPSVQGPVQLSSHVQGHGARPSTGVGAGPRIGAGAGGAGAGGAGVGGGGVGGGGGGILKRTDTTPNPTTHSSTQPQPQTRTGTSISLGGTSLGGTSREGGGGGAESRGRGKRRIFFQA